MNERDAEELLTRTVSDIGGIDEAARTAARARIGKLTMPYWALGRVLDLSVELAGMTSSLRPPVARRTIVTMAGDHGVAAEGVSKYPSEVTPQMVYNFARGGAGINALARVANARVIVVDMGVAVDLDPAVVSDSLDAASAGSTGGAPHGSNGAVPILVRKIRKGTDNIAAGPAMSRGEAIRSLAEGIALARDLGRDTDLFGTGDMGIANTTPSAAILAAVSGRSPAEIAGRGTGLDDAQLENKVRVIVRALEVNRPDARDGVDILAKVGGFEIGGLAGLMLGAASLRKPVVVDGFISSAAAALASLIAPASRSWMIPAHMSEERGHAIACAHLGFKPLLDLNMRLGEGTGAALAMTIVEGAARVLSEVATFDEAAVSEADK